MTRVSLVVAVLTYRRPELLTAALGPIRDQVREVNVEVARARAGPAGQRISLVADILIVDNDPAGSAETVVGALPPDSRAPIRYVLEPEPGISAGRNRALDESRDRDLLVFLDDDETPCPAWLTSLVDTWSGSGAAAVMGRVESTYEVEPEPWVAAGDFFHRPHRPTGSPIQVAAAGNLLLDLQQVRSLGVRFDSRLGLSGGEDTMFSRELVVAGGRIVWCDESEARDVVPASRLTREWVLTRAWRSGNTTATVDLALAAGRPVRRLWLRLRWMTRGCLRITGGAARLFAGRFTGSLHHQARGMRTLRRGQGMIGGARGVIYREYARSEGH